MDQNAAAEARTALRELAEDSGGRFYPDYSGRFMFGKTCVGIVTSDPQRVEEEAVMMGIRGARRDDMGLKTIVYWPNIPSGEDGAEPKLNPEAALEGVADAEKAWLKSGSAEVHRRIFTRIEDGKRVREEVKTFHKGEGVGFSMSQEK